MEMKLKYLIYGLFILLAYGCSTAGMGGANTGPKPHALGKMNEIVVIADKDLWEGAVGDTFKFYFGSAYPIMPTPEPIFDIRHFDLKDLTVAPLRKELRTYVILADLNDTDSDITKMVGRDLGENKYDKSQTDNTFNSSIGKDKWAKGQVLFYLFANGEDKLANTIGKNFPGIATRVNKHDEEKLSQSIFAGAHNLDYISLIEQKYGINIKIPMSFQKALDVEDLTWFRRDDREYTLNLVFDKKRYENQNQLETQAIKDWITDFGKTYVTSDQKGDKLIINDTDLPIFDYTKEIKGAFAKELRGTWEMTEEFLAGPFFGYSILNEKSNEVIYALAFISAPGKVKRDRMQQLEHMIQSLEWME